MQTSISFLLFALILSFSHISCTHKDNHTFNHPQSPTPMKAVNLEALNLSIQLDTFITVKRSGQVYLFEDANRKLTRSPRNFQIGPVPPGLVGELFDAEEQNGDWRITYSLKDDHQGSSGNEQHLHGLLVNEKAGASFSIKAWEINGDSGNPPHAAWCLPYFRTVSETEP